MYSFEETVSTLFDDSGLEADLGMGRPVFGRDVDAELRALQELLPAHRSFRNPDEIIDDPLMAEARHRAAAILRAIPGIDHKPPT